MLGLMGTLSASEGGGDLGGFQLHRGISSSDRDSMGIARLPNDDEAFNMDPGFSFDVDGLMIEEPSPSERANQIDNVKIASDSATSQRARQSLLEGLRAGQPEVRS